jgi:hypothetical protein
VDLKRNGGRSDEPSQASALPWIFWKIIKINKRSKSSNINTKKLKLLKEFILPP